jgi:predicted  nucleic acid-binding Zn-ribbon protein
MTAPTAARLTALEAEAFRAQRHQEHVSERLDYITNALGELSQTDRSVALDIREIRAELRDLHGEVQAGFAAVLERLDTLGQQSDK